MSVTQKEPSSEERAETGMPENHASRFAETLLLCFGLKRMGLMLFVSDCDFVFGDRDQGVVFHALRSRTID
jgi:hypothetical protein